MDAAGRVVTLLRMASPYPAESISPFASRLRPLGKILEIPDTYVWCNTPIHGPDGRVHVFFSRWNASRGMGGWINACEIAHAVADRPEGPYEVRGTILSPRGGDHFDATTCHNPHVQKIGEQYVLLFIGNRNARTDTKRIGLATAPTLDGPWTRPDRPLIEPGTVGAWDDHCTSNPSLVHAPDGSFRLYYKSWNTNDYVNAPDPKIRGNRKYGLATSRHLLGPYERHPANPVIDFAHRGNNTQLEDAYVWLEGGRYRMLVRDMGWFDHEAGLILESDDGIRWGEPKVAWQGASHYIELPPRPKHLNRYGRFERPQLLMRDGRPTHLFTAMQGGRHETACGFVFALDGA
jgi:hypothetical protein